MTRIVGTNLTWPYYIQFKSNYKYFSINKQINVITNVMKTKAIFCLCFTKINIKVLF